MDERPTTAPVVETVQAAKNMPPSTHPEYDPTPWHSIAVREHRAGRDLAEVASQITADFEREIREIEKDQALTERGKAPLIAAIRARAASAVTALESYDTEQREAELATLHGALRRPEPTAVGSARFSADLAYRDGLDRSEAAAKKDGSRGLFALYGRATRSGDATLARACLATALDRWDSTDVIDAWMQTHPEDRPKLDRLREIEGRKNDLQTGFFKAVRFRKI